MCREVFRAGSIVVAAALLAASAPSARAGDSDLPLPRWASLSSDKVYLRQGPTYKNRILWVYHRKGLPVEITAQYDVWRKVVMPDGAQGWIHVAMLSSDRTVVVTGKANVPLRAGPGAKSQILALAQPGVVAKLGRCDADTCQVKAGGADGWINKKKIWGVRLGGSIR